jgi:hypothetical protein
MADISIQEQILIELKRQNALLEEQLRPQREADARKKKQDEIRQSPEFLALVEKYNKETYRGGKPPPESTQDQMRNMLDV